MSYPPAWDYDQAVVWRNLQFGNELLSRKSGGPSKKCCDSTSILSWQTNFLPASSKSSKGLLFTLLLLLLLLLFLLLLLLLLLLLGSRLSYVVRFGHCSVFLIPDSRWNLVLSLFNEGAVNDWYVELASCCQRYTMLRTLFTCNHLF
jgi:hypothetical protein